MGAKKLLGSIHLVIAFVLSACATSPAAQPAIVCDGGAVANGLGASVGGVAENGRCWQDGWIGNGYGTAEAGAPCRNSLECAPTCCSCGPLGGLSATAALCSNGVCADMNTTCCAYATDNTFDPSCFPQPKTGGTD